MSTCPVGPPREHSLHVAEGRRVWWCDECLAELKRLALLPDLPKSG